jgi:hypothetical protein
MAMTATLLLQPGPDAVAAVELDFDPAGWSVPEGTHDQLAALIWSPAVQRADTFVANLTIELPWPGTERADLDPVEPGWSVLGEVYGSDGRLTERLLSRPMGEGQILQLTRWVVMEAAAGAPEVQVVLSATPEQVASEPGVTEGLAALESALARARSTTAPGGAES